MKKYLVLFVLMAIGSSIYGYKIMADEREKELVRIPLENYLKGHETGNPEFMKKAFYTEGKLIFMREGKYMTRTFEEYIAGMKDGKPAADEAQRKRWIESIDISGNAATGKIILDYPNVKFTDYMTLLKIDGEWKIVNKSFYAEPKEKKQGE
ncbi:MAG: nuclear transport factor 2 family protein [Pyrinomonadaceae bacterium]|nr:nuclear transport factor 2 family protein [Pyrinomonadaceae bacterium]